MKPIDYYELFITVFAFAVALFILHIQRKYDEDKKLRNIGNFMLSLKFMKHEKDNLFLYVLLFSAFGVAALLDFLGKLAKILF